MDVSGVQTASLASGLDQKHTVGVKVLKKAMDIQKESALQLIESIPAPAQPTGNLGNKLDVFA